ncbi:MAG: zinc ribbon domain-containing protein [Ruminococcus sp.]|jgi:hypothetical protein|nr:zinc ribbon domain-containing protein [Ruminococcus sp.]
MNCPKCKSEITEDYDFCSICGAKLSDMADDFDVSLDEDVTPKSEHKNKKSRKRKFPSKAELLKKAKIAGVVLAVIAVLIIIIVIIVSLRSSEGERVAAAVPLGRTIDIVQKETGVEFKQFSAYAYMRQISEYDYVYESDEKINVDGIELPQWAVLLAQSASKNIYKVVYFDFTQLHKSWKGVTKANKFDINTVEYKDKFSNVKKLFGQSPYAVITTLEQNRSKCIFRYNADDELGNSAVYNITVSLDDADETVIDITEEEIDYINFFFSAE